MWKWLCIVAGAALAIVLAQALIAAVWPRRPGPKFDRVVEYVPIEANTRPLGRTFEPYEPERPQRGYVEPPRYGEFFDCPRVHGRSGRYSRVIGRPEDSVVRLNEHFVGEQRTDFAISERTWQKSLAYTQAGIDDLTPPGAPATLAEACETRALVYRVKLRQLYTRTAEMVDGKVRVTHQPTSRFDMRVEFAWMSPELMR